MVLQSMTYKVTASILILCILAAGYATVGAKEQKSINIENNYQELISLKRYPSLAKLYYAGELSFTTSTPKQLKVIVKDDSLVFWHKHSVSISSSELIVEARGKEFFIPISLNTQENPFDYNIFDDMYDLSLQEKSLSCESSATADILESFLGKNIHEDRVISILPKGSHYNTLPEEHPNNIKVWGNPELGFVGHIDHTSELSAKQKLMTGYGVYEAPISDVYQNYGFYTEIFNSSRHNGVIGPDMQLRYLLEKLQNGSMVQLWGDWCTQLEYDDGILETKNNAQIGGYISTKNTCYNVDEKRELKWKYYDQNGELQEHTGLDGEHAFILLGWKGNIKNPSHIRVWDTDTGYHLYPKKEWMRKWEKMDYRSIVITKKDS